MPSCGRLQQTPTKLMTKKDLKSTDDFQNADISEEAKSEDCSGEENSNDNSEASMEIHAEICQNIFRTLFEELLNQDEDKEPFQKTIKYRSKGAWFSKMIVTYDLQGEKHSEEVEGDGSRVDILETATDIKVRFQVRRPVWGDVMKYDRFRKEWIEPYKPHGFQYKKPTDRTFTLSGNLWYEAVMSVRDEYHEETNEMH